MTTQQTTPCPASPAAELHLIESIVAAHSGGIGIADIELVMAQR